jgi:multidrug resistance protein MdtO
MATLAQSTPQSVRPLTWIRDFLNEELAPYPGRAALVARMTIAATLVMILTMTFRIPYGAYGAMYALTISRENPDTTIKAVKTIFIAFALSVVYIVVAAMFFLQDPNLRLAWVIATLFVLFYALSAVTNYTAVARFGYLLVITIPLWDRQIPLELKVEQTLWVFGAIALASVITVLVELAYTELKPGDFVTRLLAERLAAVAALLDCYAAGRAVDSKTDRELTHWSLVGTSRLRRLLRRSSYSPQYRELMGAILAHVARLVDIAANMKHFTFEVAHEDKERVRTLAAKIGTIRSELLKGQVARGGELSETGTAPALPLFGEMEKTVSIIREIFAGQHSLSAYAPSTGGDPPAGFFMADARSNPEHIKFGLKGCLAASLCYLTYNAKAWPGISTSIMTCFLTALSTVGSSRQKQILRLCGAIVGGVVVGIGAEVFILPHLDSIAGFTLLFSAVTIVAAWFATSSPRLSYFGVQLALAFYLVNVSDFSVQTSLEPARDRVIGVLLGLLMMWLVFDQLWGSPAVVEMKKTFISSLRLLAQFAREPISRDRRVAIERSYSLRETINSNFDKVRALGDGVLLEFGRSREQDLAFRNRIRQWQTHLRMLFITQIATWKYRVQLPGFELPDPIAAEQRDFDDRLAGALDAMADQMEGRLSEERLTFENAVASLERSVQDCNLDEAPPSSLARLQAFLSLHRRIESLITTLEKEI